MGWDEMGSRRPLEFLHSCPTAPILPCALPGVSPSQRSCSCGIASRNGPAPRAVGEHFSLAQPELFPCDFSLLLHP